VQSYRRPLMTTSSKRETNRSPTLPARLVSALIAFLLIIMCAMAAEASPNYTQAHPKIAAILGVALSAWAGRRRWPERS
jgi:hypothetical protein